MRLRWARGWERDQRLHGRFSAACPAQTQSGQEAGAPTERRSQLGQSAVQHGSVEPQQRYVVAQGEVVRVIQVVHNCLLHLANIVALLLSCLALIPVADPDLLLEVYGEDALAGVLARRAGCPVLIGMPAHLDIASHRRACLLLQ